MSVTSGSADTERLWHKPLFVLLIASSIVFVSFGIRQSLGLFMRPITLDLGWGREVLSVALATQNLMIGVAAPFAGALAVRWGAPRTVALGGALFGLGIFMMSQSTAPEWMFTSAGLMAGIGLGACGLPLILAVVGQVAPEAKRSLWLGVATAGATGGQLLVVPLSQSLLSGFDWVVALLALSVLAGLIVPMAFSMSGAITPDTGKDTDIDIKQALRESATHRGYLLLTAGFYVCGFQVAFIAVHLPAYLVDQGANAALGATALMLIAFFNMIGSWTSGWLAGHVSKKYLLSSIYVTRALVILVFITLPVTPVTVVVFSAVVGILWLSTVPPTSSLVAQIFGTRYMGMLYGVVYLSHQLGSFTGVWLGGRIFDATGSYVAIWWGAIALGIITALLHLPIDERPVERLAESAT
jgi:predicted MFS family arabinose efflux permease